MRLPRHSARHASRLRRAFTLMEVLVVVAIIVVLAGIATVSFRYLGDSKYDTARAKIKKIETAAGQYKMKNGGFPANVRVLTEISEGQEAYLDDEDAVDPWGNEFIIDSANINKTGKPRIYSEGEPGKNKPVSNF